MKDTFVPAALDLKSFTVMTKCTLMGYLRVLQNFTHIVEFMQNSSYLNFSH